VEYTVEIVDQRTREPIRRELPKIGRNELVTIRRGSETRRLKFKKAEPLIEQEGWILDHEEAGRK